MSPAGATLIAGATAAAVAALIGILVVPIVGPPAIDRLGWAERPGARRRWGVATTAAACLLALLAAGVIGPGTVEALLLGVFAGVCPALVHLDLRLHRLPDRIVLPALAIAAVVYLAGIALAAALALPEGSWPGGRAGGWWVPPACAAGGAALFGLIHLVPRSGLGLGDVKFSAVSGLVTGLLGWPTAVAAVYLGVLAAGFSALFLVVSRRRRADEAIAYGPYLILGAWAATTGSALLGA